LDEQLLLTYKEEGKFPGRTPAGAAELRGAAKMGGEIAS
jgi:hypothetical protein